MPPEDRWTTLAELAGPRLREGLAIYGAALQTDRADIQGQRLVEAITWRLALRAAQARIDETPAPDLSAANARHWIGDDPPDGDGLQLLDDRPRDDPADAAVHAHLAPLVAAVGEATNRPRKALERAVQDRLDAAVAWLAETGGRRHRALQLLDNVRVLDLGTHDMLLHVREGCCLYYRTPAAVKCFSCPLLDDEDRRRLVTGGG